MWRLHLAFRPCESNGLAWLAQEKSPLSSLLLACVTGFFFRFLGERVLVAHTLARKGCDLLHYILQLKPPAAGT